MILTDAVGDDDFQLPIPIRDANFWMSDGTITLVAEDVEFRIYKSVLAEHSPFFAQMFTLPQPDTPAAPHASCPVVELSDNPEDLRHVFHALLPRKNARYSQIEHTAGTEKDLISCSQVLQQRASYL